MEINRNGFIGLVEDLEGCQMKELNLLSVAERVGTKVTPLGKAKKKFITEKLNLENVPAEYREKYHEVMVRHHDAIIQHKFDLR